MKNIEEAARKFLARNKVSAFPVDTVEIAKSKGYTVASYSQAKGLLKLSCLASYAQGHRGFSAKLANTVYIFYSDDLSPDNLRRVVAHELGHIYLHFTINGVIGDSADAEAMQEMEEEAQKQKQQTKGIAALFKREKKKEETEQAPPEPKPQETETAKKSEKKSPLEAFLPPEENDILSTEVINQQPVQQKEAQQPKEKKQESEFEKRRKAREEMRARHRQLRKSEQKEEQ